MMVPSSVFVKVQITLSPGSRFETRTPGFPIPSTNVSSKADKPDDEHETVVEKLGSVTSTTVRTPPKAPGIKSGNSSVFSFVAPGSVSRVKPDS